MKAFIKGILSAFNLFPTPIRKPNFSNPDKSDADAIRSDWEAVGGDFIQLPPYRLDRPNYDISIKQFEVQERVYTIDKVNRKLINASKWRHYKYYDTFRSGRDAIKDIRRSSYNMPYSDLKGNRVVKRYRLIKRTL